MEITFNQKVLNILKGHSNFLVMVVALVQKELDKQDIFVWDVVPIQTIKATTLMSAQAACLSIYKVINKSKKDLKSMAISKTILS